MSENAIKRRRKALRLSQLQLSERVGCTRSYIAQMESGTRFGSRTVLLKLAAALGCTVGELLDEPMPPQQAADRSVASVKARPAPNAAPAAVVVAPKVVREFERLQDRRRQLVADLSIVDARLETLLRVF